MIGQLKGTLLEKSPPALLLDVQGVGYELQASMSTFYQLPDLGCDTVIFTHFVVREDAQLLFAFADKKERTLFRSLIKVNGVGPKLALSILSSIEPTAFVQCILNNDSASLVRVPGVGKKTAERLIIEMCDKLKDLAQPGAETSPELKAVAGSNQIMQDAIGGLIALGYKPQEASRMVSSVGGTPDSVEELIRCSLNQGQVA